MAIPLHTPRQVQLIVSSIRKVMQTGDISHLSSSAYKYLYLCSGFIAHYNLYGFRAEYSDVETLRAAILRNRRSNQWFNFHPGERDYDYYMQKRDIYNKICETIAGYSLAEVDTFSV